MTLCCIWDYLIWLNSFDGFFADVIVTVLSVFGGVWLSIRLALKRFVTEKWWERKADAYEAVIASTYQAFCYYDEELHAEMTDHKGGVKLEHATFENSRQANAAIAEAKAIGALKLSDEFLERLRKLDNDLAAASQPPEECPQEIVTWVSYLNMAHDAYSKCLKDLQEIARRDLGLSK